MAEPIVINTGPLITLDRIGGLDIPGKLPFDFICPAEVRAELDEGRRTGYSDVSPDWLRVEQLRAPLSRVAASALDTGEAAVIQSLRVDSPQLAALIRIPFRSPSFPHALSGNPGESRTGPPINTFGGDAFGNILIASC